MSAFQYQFADDEYAAKFAAERRIGILAGIFAGLAIFISCLGLFGLASIVAEQRTKEIGVRKVLGASVFAVWKLLSKDFVILIAISCMIAIPFAGYAMPPTGIEKYEYRITISWWIYGMAIFGAMLITILTISYQAIKAAIAGDQPFAQNSVRRENCAISGSVMMKFKAVNSTPFKFRIKLHKC